MKKLLLLILPIVLLVSTFAVAQHQVSLAWAVNNSGGTVAGFNVKRSLATGGPYTLIGSTKLPIVQYVDSLGLVDGTTYFYVVTATGPGGESGPSNEVKATIPFLPPAAPTGLQATTQ